MNLPKQKNILFSSFVSHCRKIVEQFGVRLSSNSDLLVYEDAKFKLEKMKDLGLRITVKYLSNEYIIKNPVIVINEVGNVIREHGDWNKFKNEPEKLLKKLQFKHQLELELSMQNKAIKNKVKI